MIGNNILNKRHTTCLIGALFLSLSCGCADDANDQVTKTTKNVPDFELNSVATGKSDAPVSLLQSKDLTRLEKTLIDVIGVLNGKIVDVEENIKKQEDANHQKLRQVRKIEADIEKREDELEKQAKDNLILCLFVPNPKICSAVVLIDNDKKMQDYKDALDKAQAERRAIERKIRTYKSEKEMLIAQIDVVRQSKDRLVRAYKNPNEAVSRPQGDHAELNAQSYKINILRRIHILTQEELAKLMAIQQLAENLGSSLDNTLLLVGQLSDNVDKLIKENEALFADLVLGIVFPDAFPDTVNKLMEQQTSEAIEALLEDYDWPIEQFLRHSMGLTGETDEALFDRLLAHYASKRFEQTKRANLVILDKETVTSSLEVPVSFKPTEVSVRLNVTHTARGDLSIFLVHEESEQRFKLHVREGGIKDHIRKTFRLNTKDLEDVKGTWTLIISDDLAEDEGELVDWSIAAFEALPS